MSSERQASDTAGDKPAATEESPDLLHGPVRSRQQTITASTASFLGVSPDKVCDLLRGVWTTSKGSEPLANHELMVGMALVARYELDPFAREIYVTRDKKGRLMTIIGIDGWIKVLDRTDHYDGFEQEIHEGPDGKIDWVETRIFSKVRSHPAVYKAFATDYGKLGGYVAGTIPGHMLRLFSIRHAARLFVPLGCVVTEEEAGWIQGATPGAEFDGKSKAKRSKLNAPKEEAKPAEEPTPADIEAEQTVAEYLELIAGAETIDKVLELGTNAGKNESLKPGHVAYIDAACASKTDELKGGS